ncbi:hypothetical protein EKE94_14285 [Mesobaculum littorinae]|uniref:Integrase catalytic domain-containing protein n=1 Tax=Mesobaculum littorinae TaxID=2486419 RepID=A0A438AER0_9RHOB|nr:hypothetical protein EKE94_14285 [Mesobaculum littorinae]
MSRPACSSARSARPRPVGIARLGAIGANPMVDSPEFIAKAVRDWIGALGAKTAFIEAGSPWDLRGSGNGPADRFPEAGYCESANPKRRDDLLNGEVFYALTNVRVVIQAWRAHYDTIRPLASAGYRPPAPEAVHWSPPDGGSPPTQSTSVAPRPVMNQV